jgi:hypothetical protein
MTPEVTESPRWARRDVMLTGLLSLFSTGCATGASAPPGPQAPPMSLPSSPHRGESGTLRERLRGTLVARHRVGPSTEAFELDLRTGIRTPRAGSRGWAVATFSEPDQQGRVVFGWTSGGEEPRRSGFDLLERSGQRRTLWRTDLPAHLAFGGELALSPNGSALAFLRNPQDPQAQKGTPAGFRLWVLATEPASSAKALLEDQFVLGGLVDASLSWLGDNRHLAAVVQGPRGRAAGAPQLSREEPDAQIVVVNAQNGEVRATFPGRQVWASSDGASLLIRQHHVPEGLDPAEVRQRRAWALRPNDLVRRVVQDGAGAASDSRSASGPRIGPPQALAHVPPEITAVIGWLDDRYLVYRGDVTPGAPSGLTTGNSPLVGPKRLQAVKVMDSQTGEFLTVLEGVDPRWPFSVR